MRLYEGKADVCERLQKARSGGSVEPGDGCNEGNESTQGLGGGAHNSGLRSRRESKVREGETII